MSLESISSGRKNTPYILRVIPEKKDPGYKSTPGLQPLKLEYKSTLGDPLKKNICKKTFPYRSTPSLIRKDVDMASLNKSLLEKFLKPLGKKLGKVLRFIK